MHSADDCLSLFDKQWSLQQTSHLVPVRQRLCRCRWQPNCCSENEQTRSTPCTKTSHLLLELWTMQLVFSFPGSRFPGARSFSFLDSRELKRRHSREKRERVKDNCSLNETPDSCYSAFKRQLLVSYQHHAVPRSYTHRSVAACRTVGCHPCLSGHESRLTT